MRVEDRLDLGHNPPPEGRRQRIFTDHAQPQRGFEQRPDAVMIECVDLLIGPGVQVVAQDPLQRGIGNPTVSFVIANKSAPISEPRDSAH